MSKKDEKEELQTRRQFFKKAAKSILPMLGAVAIGPSTILSAMTSCTKSGCDGCEAECMDNCGSSCSELCDSSSTSSACSGCASGCASACEGACSNACTSSSANSSGGGNNNSGVSEASGTIDGHDYVDMGLSVKWARSNIGTSSPEGYGSYYSFGDPSGYNISTWGDINYYYAYDNAKFKNKKVMDSQFDSATYKWGKKWRMPTNNEFKELINNTTMEFCSINNKHGIKLVSKKNQKSIFLPAAGFKNISSSNKSFDTQASKKDVRGYYWTSLVYNYSDFSCCAYAFIYDFEKNKFWMDLDGVEDMWLKMSIRPVTTGSSNGGGGGGGGTSGCGTNCSDGCKTTCSGTCPNGCNTLCGGQCKSSCGGTCEYVSAGSQCTGCARTCSSYCYRTCTLACSSSCYAYCVNSAG